MSILLCQISTIFFIFSHFSQEKTNKKRLYIGINRVLKFLWIFSLLYPKGRRIYKDKSTYISTKYSIPFGDLPKYWYNYTNESISQ